VVSSANFTMVLEGEWMDLQSCLNRVKRAGLRLVMIVMITDDV